MYSALHVLGIPGKPSEVDVVELLSKGLTKSNYLKAKDFTGFSHQDMAQILSVSTKTLETKRGKDRLSDSASERLLKLAEVAALGKAVFTDAILFREWLHRPLRPLEGKKPADLMVNMYGLEMVRQLLGRIEHGVYS